MTRRTPIAVDLPGLTGFDAARPAAESWTRRHRGLPRDLRILIALEAVIIGVAVIALAVLW